MFHQCHRIQQSTQIQRLGGNFTALTFFLDIKKKFGKLTGVFFLQFRELTA